MKRFVLVVLVMALGALAYAGADKSYTNSVFKFTLQYPDDWQVKEQKTDMPDMGAAAAMLGQKMAGGMRMTTVCFGEKKCEPGDFGKDPQANLIVADIDSMKRFAPKGKPANGQRGSSSGKGGQDSPECDVIEKTSVKWGGTLAPWMTMRCPEKNKWRYTTTVTMQRAAGSEKDAYNLMCSMLSSGNDKEASLAEYQANIKPRCQKLVSTTKFSK